MAIRLGEHDILSLLLKGKACVNLTNELGHTSLHTAAHMVDSQAAQMLLAAKADVSLADEEGTTAAQIAKELGHAELARMITPMATGNECQNIMQQEGVAVSPHDVVSLSVVDGLGGASVASVA